MGAPRFKDVPAELYEQDPPSPVEEDGNTRHVYFWCPVDPRWDPDANIRTLKDSIERQGHVVDEIRLDVIRTSGEPTADQQRFDELAYRRRAAIAGHYDATLD